METGGRARLYTGGGGTTGILSCPGPNGLGIGMSLERRSQCTDGVALLGDVFALIFSVFWFICFFFICVLLGVFTAFDYAFRLLVNLLSFFA